MDIARPEFKHQKRRKQIIVVAGVAVLVTTLTAAVYRLKPAAPSVERGTVLMDVVKRGSILRQVHGTGSLVPAQESVLQIPAETEATVLRIRMLPGSLVKADTILLEMDNSQVQQAAVDAQLQWKAAQAEYQSQRMKLESDLMNQKAGAATVKADYNQSQLQSQTDKSLYDLGVISGLAYRASHQSCFSRFSFRNCLASCVSLTSILPSFPGIDRVRDTLTRHVLCLPPRLQLLQRPNHLRLGVIALQHTPFLFLRPKSSYFACAERGGHIWTHPAAPFKWRSRATTRSR